ncbi:hypothetical protein EV359DRAFT_88334 [Lentinula novae-zelandiae]|nr:hypothetical protein EV359DRAFT_88334 [Lentinula novae-zelandiae]
MNRDHFFDQAVGNGSYDTEYIEAVLSNDQEEISHIETLGVLFVLGAIGMVKAHLSSQSWSSCLALAPFANSYRWRNSVMPALIF